MGLSPDVDNEGVTVLTVDEAPVSIEGIKQGHLLASNSQGFWLQGYAPMEWLYWNKELGYEPQSDILTGPVIIHGENAEHGSNSFAASSATQPTTSRTPGDPASRPAES